MDVLIISADNIYLTPYIKFYIRLLEQNNLSYKVIYWDKNNNEIIDKKNYERFTFFSTKRGTKVFGYLKFRKKLRKELKLGNYKFVIPLHTIIGFLIGKILINKYNKRYTYDVRDYSYEKYKIYRDIQKKLVNNSAINIISSAGYKKFLPKTANYYIKNNIPTVNNVEIIHKQRKANEVINISYIGLIRFMEQNKKILLFFKNDERFHLNFIGTNAKKLEDFCKSNEIKNVTLIDTFSPNETLNYYNNTDLIMNIYGNNTPLLDYALSNKLYYSAILNKPILVSDNTYMEKITKKYHLGMTMYLEDKNELNHLFNYVNTYDRKEFKNNSDKFLSVVKKEDQNTENKINKILRGLKK